MTKTFLMDLTQQEIDDLAAYRKQLEAEKQRKLKEYDHAARLIRE